MINKKACFSLLEAMIALLILMVGVMGLATAFQRSIAQTNASKNDTVAMAIASGIVDNLESRPFESWDTNASLAAISELFYSDFQGNYLIGAPADAYFKPLIVIMQDYETHRDIRITIDWSDMGGLEEMRKAGFISSTVVHTFVLESTIAQTYGDSVFGG